ncbi:hypothetical protein [Chitinimonas sp. BJB300]|nr:hypothetical protein [Chitinimonas sp. BJB300]
MVESLSSCLPHNRACHGRRSGLALGFRAKRRKLTYASEVVAEQV